MTERQIFAFLKSQGLSDAGAAGAMGNMFAESGLNSRNLQNSYEKKLGYYNNNGLNVISNPNNFSDSANGTLVGTPSSGYPSDFTIPTASGLEWALFPSAANGSQTTYVPDYWFFYGSSPCLYHGGYYLQGQNHGPFYVSYGRASYSSGVVGCRLQERPPKAA